MRRFLFFGLIVAGMTFFASCEKDDIIGSDLDASKGYGSQGRHGGDRPHPTPIDISLLPASVTDYVQTNFTGATINRAGTLPNGNYVVQVQVEGEQPIGLLFDASGNFIETLPAHHNGHGGDRPHPTPIDISLLPTSVTDYVQTNFTGATINRAGTLPNGNYVVVVQLEGETRVRLLFDASGNFIKVLLLPFGG